MYIIVTFAREQEQSTFDSEHRNVKFIIIILAKLLVNAIIVALAKGQSTSYSKKQTNIDQFNF